MEIKIIESNKKDFLDLLLLADEQENMIDKYLDRGILFALYDEGLKSICVVTDEGNGGYELQSLATYEQFQEKDMERTWSAIYSAIIKTRAQLCSSAPETFPGLSLFTNVADLFFHTALKIIF